MTVHGDAVEVECEGVIVAIPPALAGRIIYEPLLPSSRDQLAQRMPQGSVVWTTCGPALRAPCGRIYWAGTETPTVWNGYIDGALQSGERAAREVLSHRGVREMVPRSKSDQ